MNSNIRTTMTAVLLTIPAVGLGYPNGPPIQVVNGGPYCASCHSTLQERTIRELPEKKIAETLAKNKHYQAIEEGLKAYKKLEPDIRKALLKDVQAIDNNTHVTIDVPEKVTAGETFKVTVHTQGGGGPVIGVMLLDSDLRYQASPPQTVGWAIAVPPKVTGPDGKAQTKWIDKRYDGLTKNINFVTVYDVKSDPRKGVYPEAKVIYTLKAPMKKGEYPLAAAMLFGTEKASPVGYTKEVFGKLPVGGFGAASGRIIFTDLQTIAVD